MSEVQQLEDQLNQTKEIIAFRELAIQLSKNRAFKKLILEEFCIHECARYAQISGDPAFSEEDRANALAMAQAAGHLRRFLSVTIQMGNRAEADLKSIEEELEIARAEEI